MRHAQPVNSRHGGFTLGELLVIGAIIATLVSLLLASVAKAHGYVLRVQCASNMREIYAACILCANENKGLLPRPTWGPEPPITGVNDNICWFWDGPGVANLEQGVLWKYIPPEARKTIILCPADSGERPVFLENLVTVPRNHSYSFNANIRLARPDGRLTSIKIQSVLSPARKIMIYEELAPKGAACLDPDWFPESYPTGRHGARTATNARRETYDAVYFRYGKGNHVFFDGHVETLRPADIIGHGESYRPLIASGE